MPSSLPATEPAVSQVRDLLTQLKAAGTIDAEVIKLLQGSKLLLSSRLGDILTTNNLSYKPGDKLRLRFDDSAQQPILKVSQRYPKPIILDSRQHPELARALLPDRPMLAQVIKLAAQQAQIRLAGAVLTLPRQVAPSRNGVLSLQRNDIRHQIEITPIDSKAIYRAMLKQLVPRQAENSGSSLIRFLNLITPGAIEPQPALTQRSGTGWPQRQDGLKSMPAADGKPVTRVNDGHALDKALVKPAGGSQTGTINTSTAPGKNGESSSPIRTAPSARLLTSIDSRNPPSGARQAAPLANKIGTVTPPRATTPGAGKNVTTMPTRPLNITAPVRPGRPSINLVQAGVTVPTMRNTVVDKTGSQTRVAGLPIEGNAPYRSVSAAFPGTQITSAQTIQAAAAQTASLSGQPSGANTALPALQPLLQLVSRFPDIDANRIKNWLDFAGLVYGSRSEASTTAQPGIFRLLKQFSDGESYIRELSQVLQQNPRAPADDRSPTTRAQAQEALLMQAREGAKLIEQSLSHNLLQRASLGLQQETQQPLSLSFALPFVDDQQTKALYIDLAQRNRAQQEEDKSWDIMLSFDLSNLGPISCHLVFAGCTISASFYSEHAQTRERIEIELPRLRQQLSRVGLNPGELHSFSGKPASNRASTVVDYSEALIDIEV